jgi:excinuclease ABC subunit A
VTGVSGSGKSTLVHDVLYAALKRAKGDWDRKVGAHQRLEGHEFVSDVVLVDQTPIGRTPRSNPGHLSQGLRSDSASCSRRRRMRNRAA